MSDPSATFGELQLCPQLLQSLSELGYETPSPVQAACIPRLLAGADVLGMAQTGTGKTAAFALPLLQRVDLSLNQPQVLVLTPTRELAIQVAEAFQAYARHLPGFHVLPIYGGQSYQVQLRQLSRGPQVVVGTPGRVIDHLGRDRLKLDRLQALVLDEADEMLRMGFIDDVESIMAQTPEGRQTALFSATMPEQIRRITTQYMNNPEEIRIAAKTSTVANIEQLCWKVEGVNKLDALTRMLETEDYDGVILFARTKTATTELAEKLEARGYAAAALNGDMNQAQRERTVSRLKGGQLDILVATDVAARGLDVDRISLVINYDIPYDTEAYVHRIGRTGRAGRQGRAILFYAHRERRLLKAIEKATRQPINPMPLPSRDQVTQKRIASFRDRVVEVFGGESLQFYRDLSHQLAEELKLEPQDLAAALLYLAQQDKPLQLPPEAAAPEKPKKPSKKERKDNGSDSDVPWESYRLEVGRSDGVQVKHIVGAIANEADLDSRYIGRIKLHQNFSTVDLPEGMPPELLKHLQGVRICGKPTKLKRDKGAGGEYDEAPRRKPKKRALKS
ncbi:DEAD/DEAH box helicase [Motiliproteus sp. SC1-56]|uniref:DEAD/DEAH box helicase n=1 Tax=Motiliproteus sp. SC1-56 TaxID=2799565 RepID=UPI001A8DE54B|nr:DEAD/DEAH box helicase [Motiliproteus sp. SC1-56]